MKSWRNPTLNCTAEKEPIGTPYDDVYRTLVLDCPRLLIPMINEIFNEHFTKEDEIVFSKDIYKFNGRADKAETRMTDSVFEIIGVVRKRFLLECQVNPDNSMLVRMFEYATLVALRCRIEEDQILRVDYPYCAVLFLRSTRSTPDKMGMKITSPQGNLSVDVLVMKVRDYTLDEMIAKDLLFLFPFYLFKFSKYRLKQCNENPERLKTITNDYRRIASYLEELTEKNELSEFYHRTLIELSNKVVGKLARNYGNVVKGVDEIMGGKLIETEARKIMDEGRREGRQEGRQEEIANTERERLRADAAELRYQDSEKKNQGLLATVSWLQEQMSQLQMKLTQVELAE
ncbi:MAG: hypothetical protein LIP11_16930 [Clostridiales bacterium]|nr:hypothetical protein [Clostridiales bacterium]